MSTRDDNIQKLWLRPTIPWKLSCEYDDSISRQDALQLFQQQFNLLNFIDNFMFIGFCIVCLFFCPLIIYQMRDDQLEGHRIIKYYPYLTRLLFIVIFFNMALLVDEKHDLCMKYLGYMKIFTQTNLCMDKYSQVDIKKVEGTLEELDVKLMWLLGGFILIFTTALCELVFLVYTKMIRKGEMSNYIE